MKKKDLYGSGGSVLFFLKKNLLKMKLTFLCLLLGLVQLMASNSIAQSTRLTLNLKDTRVEDVLMKIEEQSNLYFIYNRAVVDVNRRVSVSCNEKRVSDILDELFIGTDVDYEVLNRHIILKNKIEETNQPQTISGRVTDSGGEALPGVTVLVKGTSIGVITNEKGDYSILNIQENATLVFSFVGMKSQEVILNGQKIVNIKLVDENLQVGEVVVTALGIKREEKTLTYANQTVSGEDLTKTRDQNFMNSLSGKAAGIEIKKSSSGAGGSTRVVLRGSKSLSGDSEPLYVIDGIPIANNKGDQPTMMVGVDQGDGISQINPDDIESINILKGSNAAVLYGSQGANGVVLITTKKGKEGTASVSFSSGLTFENVLVEPELQFKYGTVSGAKESWSYTPGEYASNYVNDFFRTGHNAINSVTISGGNSKTTAYFSYANTSSKGIYPENKYNKNNVTFKQSTKLLKEKLTVSSSVMLASEASYNRAPSGYYLNPLTGLYFFPRDKDFNTYKENYQVFNSVRNLNLQNWFVSDHFQNNPYWILNKEPKTDLTKRVIGNGSINYKINDKISFEARGSYDYSLRSFEQQHAAGTNSTQAHKNGAWDYSQFVDELIYADAIFKYDDKFGDFTLNSVIGASYQKTTYGLGVKVNSGTLGLLFPNEFYFQNLATNVPVLSTLKSRLGKQAAFGNAQIGFKEMVYVDFSGRFDWASTLIGTGNESYFYPAIGVTGIVSEMLKMPAFISFAKVRGSYTTVANEVPFNVVQPQNSINNVGGVTLNQTKPFTDLKPEMIRSLELGTNLRFFKNRLGIDFTYYNINSQDQFIALPAPAGSSYTTYYVNAGEIVNKGIELTVDGTPIKAGKFEWKSAVNFSKNNNEVVKLHDNLKTPISTGGSEGYDSKFYAGGSIGDVYVYKFKRDDQGRIMLDANTGKPLKTALTEYIGNLEPEWSLGWNNNLSYRNISLNFQINGKFGGVVVSQTEAMLDGYGVSQRTADARDAGFVSINGVKNGVAVTTIDPKLYYTATGDRNGIKEPYVFDRTNVRLSQLSLTYDFNMKALSIPIKNASVSFVGQNLFFLFKEAPFDPELVGNTSRNYQSLDNFNMPSTRTLGFNVKVTF